MKSIFHLWPQQLTSDSQKFEPYKNCLCDCNKTFLSYPHFILQIFHAKTLLYYNIIKNNRESKRHIMCGSNFYVSDVKTLSISGLKSRVLKLLFSSLKMIAKSGLEFILKSTEPLQRYLLSCQANLANLGRYFCTGQQQL